MSQENFLEPDPSFSPDNENPGIRAKIIGVGGAGLSLVDGLRFDDFMFWGVKKLYDHDYVKQNIKSKVLANNNSWLSM